MKKMYKNCLTLSLLVTLGFCSALVSAKPKGMTPVDLLNISTLTSAKVSPNGQQVVFLKHRSDWHKNKQVSDIWMHEKNKLESRQLTFDAYRESDIAWSPDQRFISFVAKRDNDKYDSLYLLPLNGGEAFKVIEHKADIDRYQWSSDSQSIYFLADEPLSKEIEKRKKSKDDMFAFEEPLSFKHLWKFSVKTKKIKQVTKGDFHLRGFTLSNDGQLIAFTRANDLQTIDTVHSAEVWVMDNRTGRSRRVTDNSHAEYAIQISPDNNKLLFIADVNEKGEYYYDANLFVVSLKDQKIRALALDQTFEVEGARWSKSGQEIYIRANMGVHSEIWAIAEDNSYAKQLTEGDHTVKTWHYNTRSDSHVFSLATAKNPGELWLMKGPGGGLQRVTSLYKDLSSRYHLPEQKLIRWKSSDGVMLEGLLSLPMNYRKGKRYPLVVHTHGGPRSSDQYGQFRWRTYIPVLSAKGYAYFTPNYRGGRGYGDDFMRDMVGGYFTNAHLDVMSGIDHLIDQGIADPDKLIAAGWSAGGHMTNKLITHTKRFKAASSGAGAVDWVSMYGQSDTRYGRTPWFGGAPWQKNAPWQVYRDNSPLKDLWKVTTPTLIFVGQRDVRVPTAQSMILYRALRDLGVESKLYIAPREPHGFRELRHRLFKINAELEWFGRHARNRKYQWQAVPETEND